MITPGPDDRCISRNLGCRIVSPARFKVVGLDAYLFDHRPPEIESAVPILKKWLEACGITREGNESLAETVARAMGISPAELRRHLLLRAVGSA